MTQARQKRILCYDEIKMIFRFQPKSTRQRLACARELIRVTRSTE